MYKHCNLMFMVCESPLHAGSGSDLDFIDNPIQRERHTGFPKIESSSLKGALRERYAEVLTRNDTDLLIAFGPDSENSGTERQGSLGFSDARLLLFPVKSMKGVFAWVTCPSVLQKLVQDMRKTDGNENFIISGLVSPDDNEAIVFPDNALITSTQGDKKFIVLEEFALIARDDASITIEEISINEWLAGKLFPVTGTDKTFEYWNKKIASNLVILTDNDFSDFVELTTEVITRNKINPLTGTVQNGHLFTEEYLPTDSVLYNLIMSHAEFHKNGGGKNAEVVMGFFTDNLKNEVKNAFQVGGNATIGKGLIRTILMT